MSGISSQFEFGSCLDYGSRATVGVGYGPAEDGLRARYAPASGGLYYLFLWDPQGSVQQRHTDGSYTGGFAAYDRSTFEGYGALRQANKGSTGAIVGQHDPAGFGGQFGYYTDTETGLLCLTHRYYDPGTGKFINRDPIGYQGGANLYGFADGNPVNESDPSGFAGGPGTPGSGNEEESDDIFMQRELQEVIEARREEETREEQEKQGSLGRALELRALLRNRNQPIIRSFPEWRTGGSITQITPQGTFPEWWASTAPAKPYTIQGRYWINRASLAQNNEFTSRQLGQMQMGFAPSARVMVRNNRTSLIETRNVSKELHHSGGRNISNANEPFYIYEVWPWQHAGIDPQRNTGYTFLQFMK